MQFQQQMMIGEAQGTGGQKQQEQQLQQERPQSLESPAVHSTFLTSCSHWKQQDSKQPQRLQ
jgi:hypothetical protein